MTVLASNPDQIENFYNNAKQTPYIPELGPGFFDNSIAPIGQGFERGELEIANFFSPEQSNQAGIIRDAMVSAVPDPHITGWLGNTLYGVSSAIPALAAGSALGGPLGGATLLGATKGFTRTQELEAKNVSPGVATSLGFLEGGTQALGALVPAGIGTTLIGKVLSGAGINTAIGAANRKLTGTILEDNGYEDMAKQYKVVDGAQIASDLILGGIFGAMHSNAKTAKERTQNLDNNLPSDTDAALAANNIHQLEIDSAPGVATDLRTRNNHIQAMDTATQQILRGDDVNVTHLVNDSEFIPKPDNEGRTRAIDEVAKEEGYDTLSRRLDHGYEQYAAVVTRHDIAQSELGDLNKNLTDIEQKIVDLQPSNSIFGGRDAAIMSRIDEINTLIEQGALSKTQQKPLLKERQSLQEEYNALLDNSNVEQQRPINEAARTELENQRLDLIKKISQKEATVDILANELKNRGERIAQLAQPSKGLLEQIKQNATEIKQPTEIAPTENPPLTEGVKQETPPTSSDGNPSSAKAAESIPDIALAQQIATEKPDTVIPVSETETLSAAEALKQADDTIQEATSFAKLFSEAVNCFIRNGL